MNKKNNTHANTEVSRDLGKEELLRLYRQMVLLRRFESTAQELYRKGVWPGFIHLYIGEEATAVGVCANLQGDDWITSTHRGHGHALAKGISVKSIMSELFGKSTGCCGGRGGSMHLYCPSIGLLGSNGLVAGGIPLAAGTALSGKVRGTGQIGVSFFGDGASNHGAFLESMNFAAVQKLPLVFVCENNLYATATPLSAATANTDIAGKAAAFGLPGAAVDGNDVLAVYRAMREAVLRARDGQGPTLIESRTYRWCGHHEGDPVCGVYRAEEELESWKKRCPIKHFRKLLVDELEMAEDAELDEIDRRVAEEIQSAVEFGTSSPDPDPARIYEHVHADPINPPRLETSAGGETVQKTWLDAVRDGIAEEMRHDPNIIYLGEGIGERSGSFGQSKGLWKEFGGKRVIDTPICELAFTGAAIGASATGCPAIADLMFADFMFEAASQIIQQAAKLRYISNGQVEVPLVIRAPAGMIKNAGAHHSGMYYPVWGHVPGLIVVVPSNPGDAKGLMKTAIRARDPVVFLEHKSLFAMKGAVSTDEHCIPFGKANVILEGSDLTIVSCGLLVNRCIESAKILQKKGVSCEIIDLRTIVPLDVETIAASLRKTGRLLVVDEAWSMFGVGAEIAAAMMELAFDELDAPIGRLHTERVSFPFSPSLENAVAVTVDKIVAAAESVCGGLAPVQRHPKAVNVGKVDNAGETRTRMESTGKLNDNVQGSSEKSSFPCSREDVSAEKAAGCVPVLIPNMDLTVEEVRIVRWFKKVGDSVKLGEVVVEVETSKALLEIESPANGIVKEILVPEDALVALKQPVALIAEK